MPLKRVGPYVLAEQLSKDSRVEVYRGKHAISGVPVLIHAVAKQKGINRLRAPTPDPWSTRSSLALLKLISAHSNLERIFDVFTNATHLLLVSESLQDYESLDSGNVKLSPEACLPIFRQMVDALTCCLGHLFVPSYLTLDHFVADSHGHLKLRSLGTVLACKGVSTLQPSAFVAPEASLQRDTPDTEAQCVYSLGVCLHLLITRTLPFTTSSSSATDANGRPQRQLAISDGLPTHLRHLLTRIMADDPSRRITVAQIRSHPWFRTSKTAHRAPQLPSLRQPLKLSTHDRHTMTSILSFLGPPQLLLKAWESREPNRYKVFYLLLHPLTEDYRGQMDIPQQQEASKRSKSSGSSPQSREKSRIADQSNPNDLSGVFSMLDKLDRSSRSRGDLRIRPVDVDTNRSTANAGKSPNTQNTCIRSTSSESIEASATSRAAGSAADPLWNPVWDLGISSANYVPRFSEAPAVREKRQSVAANSVVTRWKGDLHQRSRPSWMSRTRAALQYRGYQPPDIPRQRGGGQRTARQQSEPGSLSLALRGATDPHLLRESSTTWESSEFLSSSPDSSPSFGLSRTDSNLSFLSQSNESSSMASPRRTGSSTSLASSTGGEEEWSGGESSARSERRGARVRRHSRFQQQRAEKERKLFELLDRLNVAPKGDLRIRSPPPTHSYAASVDREVERREELQRVHGSVRQSEKDREEHPMNIIARSAPRRPVHGDLRIRFFHGSAQPPQDPVLSQRFYETKLQLASDLNFFPVFPSLKPATPPQAPPLAGSLSSASSPSPSATTTTTTSTLAAPTLGTPTTPTTPTTISPTTTTSTSTSATPTPTPTPTPTTATTSSMTPADWSQVPAAAVPGATSAAEKNPPSPRKLARRNSTSTLYVVNTLHNPDFHEILHSVATAIRLHVVNGHASHAFVASDIFSETKYPLTPIVDRHNVPSVSKVHRFIHRIFKSEDLSAECSILALAYVERIVALKGVVVHASNWRRILLMAIVLASKVWEELAVWNSDFLALFPCMTGKDMCELEMHFLRLLQFNVNVASPLFAKYYYELRALAVPLPKLTRALNVQDRWRLDAMNIAMLEKADGPVPNGQGPPRPNRPRTKSCELEYVRDYSQLSALLVIS